MKCSKCKTVENLRREVEEREMVNRIAKAELEEKVVSLRCKLAFATGDKAEQYRLCGVFGIQCAPQPPPNPWQKGDRALHRGRLCTVMEIRVVGSLFFPLFVVQHDDGGFPELLGPTELDRIPQPEPTHEDYLQASREYYAQREFPVGQWVQHQGVGNVIGTVYGHEDGLVRVMAYADHQVYFAHPAKLTKIPAPPFEVGDWVELGSRLNCIGLGDVPDVERVCRMDYIRPNGWTFFDRDKHRWDCSLFRVVAHDKERK